MLAASAGRDRSPRRAASPRSARGCARQRCGDGWATSKPGRAVQKRARGRGGREPCSCHSVGRHFFQRAAGGECHEAILVGQQTESSASTGASPPRWAIASQATRRTQASESLSRFGERLGKRGVASDVPSAGPRARASPGPRRATARRAAPASAAGRSSVSRSSARSRSFAAACRSASTRLQLGLPAVAQAALHGGDPHARPVAVELRLVQRLLDALAEPMLAAARCRSSGRGRRRRRCRGRRCRSTARRPARRRGRSRSAAGL